MQLAEGGLLPTGRLLLRRPTGRDLEAIFAYAADPEVTRYVGWPRHRSLDDTRAFLAFGDAEWRQWSAGPLLITARDDGRVLGGTGLQFETPWRAATGYVLARAEWGRGFATEALRAVVAWADTLSVRRLYALCHPGHAASRRVLEKCGLQLEGTLRRHCLLPNLDPGQPGDVCCYARVR